MANTNLELQFIFKTDTGENEKVVIKNIKSNLDPNEALAFANDVIRNKYFIPSKGTSITDVERINLITTTTEAIF